VLVVAVVALALVVLVSAGLLLRSIERVFDVAVGFDSSRLLTLQVQETGRRFQTNSARVQFYREALEASPDDAAALSALIASADAHARRSQLVTFSYFGRIFHSVFDRRPNRRASLLSKTIHTERHKKLRGLLIARRKAARLTQTVVAERLGKPPSYVAKYEGGDRRLDVLEFLDVSAAIGFDPCALIRALLRK
jgi:hypothetical protein